MPRRVPGGNTKYKHIEFHRPKGEFPELSRQVEKVVLQRWRGASSCEQKKQDTAADQTEP